jgi:hypothetical protein
MWWNSSDVYYIRERKWINLYYFDTKVRIGYSTPLLYLSWRNISISKVATEWLSFLRHARDALCSDLKTEIGSLKFFKNPFR